LNTGSHHSPLFIGPSNLAQHCDLELAEHTAHVPTIAQRPSLLRRHVCVQGATFSRIRRRPGCSHFVKPHIERALGAAFPSKPSPLQQYRSNFVAKYKCGKRDLNLGELFWQGRNDVNTMWHMQNGQRAAPGKVGCWRGYFWDRRSQINYRGAHEPLTSLLLGRDGRDGCATKR
jgi:hypothetical protein